MSTIDISTLRHAAAHLLAMAVSELHKDAKLGEHGLSESGFYYDIEFDTPISLDELPAIQSKMLELARANLKMAVKTVARDDALQYFTEKEQPYKREILDEISTKKVDILVVGEDAFKDTTKFPLPIMSTAVLENTALLDVSGAYWKGDDKRSMLTRISGVCFPSAQELLDYQEFQAELLRRDHRVMGKKLGFFSVDPEVGTGLIFWNPRGRFVRDAVAGLIKLKMRQLGADFVETPLLAHAEQEYLETQPQSEKLLAKNVSDDTEKWYAVRQQFIGAHLRMFSWKEHSYRDLPWKVGEIGKLLRYEKVSELEGLHRAREFTQDTITTVCAREHLEKEIESQLVEIVRFARELGFFDFEVQYRLPPQVTAAQKNEFAQLVLLLRSISKKHTISISEEIPEHKLTEPEIILTVKDSLKQKRRLSKIQIFYTLPVEQQISYMGSDGESHVPLVMRTTLSGSLERVIATLIEHYAGLLPLWMTYEHARVIPVTSKQELYAEKVAKYLNERGIHATTDLDPEPLEGKIKQAEEEKIPYMLIVGEKEQNTNAISVRIQGKGDIGLLDIESFIKDLQNEVVTKSIKSQLV